jgi:hypothetical protein
MEIHILVPKELAPDIESRTAPNFEIKQALTTKEKFLHFYRVETTEEEVTALILKYGSDQVWIR